MMLTATLLITWCLLASTLAAPEVPGKLIGPAPVPAGTAAASSVQALLPVNIVGVPLYFNPPNSLVAQPTTTPAAGAAATPATAAAGPPPGSTTVVATASAATGPTLQAVTPLYQGNLDLHNSYRARHQQTGPLVWDDALAAAAAAYAAQCIWAHDPTNNGQWGENLFASSVYNDPVAQQAQGVTGWYNEISLYNFSNPGYVPGVGHFTQMVWRASTTLGCAVQNCPNGMTGWTPGRLFLVCRYLPTGNYLGQFGDNVMPLIPPPSPSPSPEPPSPSPSPSPSAPSPSPSPSPSPPAPSPSPSPSPSPDTPSPSPSPIPPSPSPTPSPSPSPLPTPSPAPVAPDATVVAAGAIIVQSGTTSTQLAAGPNCRASPNNIYTFCQRSNGKAELMKVGRSTPLWSSTNAWTPTYISNNRPFNLKLETNGRLSIFNKSNSRLTSFNSAKTGVSPYRLLIQNNGNVVVLDSRNTVVIWQTNTAGM